MFMFHVVHMVHIQDPFYIGPIPIPITRFKTPLLPLLFWIPRVTYFLHICSALVLFQISTFIWNAVLVMKDAMASLVSASTVIPNMTAWAAHVWAGRVKSATSCIALHMICIARLEQPSCAKPFEHNLHATQIIRMIRWYWYTACQLSCDQTDQDQIARFPKERSVPNKIGDAAYFFWPWLKWYLISDSNYAVGPKKIWLTMTIRYDRKRYELLWDKMIHLGILFNDIQIL